MTATSNNDIARAIFLSAKDKRGNELAKVLHNATVFLHRKKLLPKAGFIISALKKIVDKEENRMTVKVASARKLNRENKNNLAEMIKKRYSANEVNIIENLDENLLGGMRIEANDEVIDMTIKNKINLLQKYLTRENEQ